MVDRVWEDPEDEHRYQKHLRKVAENEAAELATDTDITSPDTDDDFAEIKKDGVDYYLFINGKQVAKLTEIYDPVDEKAINNLVGKQLDKRSTQQIIVIFAEETSS